MCRRYGQRPSAVIGIKDPFVSYDFDMAMAVVHNLEERSREEPPQQV